jgi:hypothetical protein
LAACLRAAGLAEPFVKPEVNTGRKWAVAHPPARTDKWVLVCMDAFGGRMYFDGDPDVFLNQPPVHCGSVCPKEVLEQFKSAKQSVLATDPMAAFAREERFKNEDNARRQREEAAIAGYKALQQG